MRSMIGKWAVCQRGRIGKIEGRKLRRGRYVYVGVTVDNLPWQSEKPIIIDQKHVGLLDFARAWDYL